MRDREVPNKLDHARIVVAIRQIMIERREAMALAGLLHVLELLMVRACFRFRLRGTRPNSSDVLP